MCRSPDVPLQDELLCWSLFVVYVIQDELQTWSANLEPANLQYLQSKFGTYHIYYK